MATATIANETEIANAMMTLGLEVWKEALLDEIELNRRLNKSLEQFKKGETLTLDELDKRITERLNNGYYLR
jgi:uncharacterized coiled-coil DUF342 family protein